ncbi:MAG: hypothetical protein CR975_04025, partial [Gammaproteobacteria bacterium]
MSSMSKINDNLLKSMQKAMLLCLQATEPQLVDLLEFDDVQEVDKIVDALTTVEGALLMLSEKTAAAVCADIRDITEVFSKDTDTAIEKDRLLYAFLALTEYVGELSGLTPPSVDLQKTRLFLTQGDAVSETIFPVSQETKESIAFAIKKDLAISKSIVEENIANLNKKKVKEDLSKSLIMPFAAFRLLNHRVGVDLIISIRKSLEKHLTQKAVKELANNMVLLEDTFWQLDTLDQCNDNKQDNSKKKQIRCSRNNTAQSAREVVASITHQFFEKLKDNVIENFGQLDKLPMMQTAQELYQIASSMTLLRQPALSRLLKKSEHQHLFFTAQQETLKEPEVNNAYLDVVILYEIIFEQLQSDAHVDKRTLMLLDEAQQHLVDATNFVLEKMSAPDYHHYAEADEMSDEEIERMMLELYLDEPDKAEKPVPTTGAADSAGTGSAVADSAVADGVPTSEETTSAGGANQAVVTGEVNADTVVAETATVGTAATVTADTVVTAADETTASGSVTGSDESVLPFPDASTGASTDALADTPTGKAETPADEGGEEKQTAEAIYQQVTDSSKLRLNEEVESISADDVDEDILEIFIEEAQDIAVLLKQETPRLKENYFDEEVIRTLRRAYHTLKGSGRMVGLNIFGEFAWQHEELLNRVIAGDCQLNAIALRQLTKACQLVEETVNQEPFVENKEVLLLSAAQAEAIKALLMGKISLPELNEPAQETEKVVPIPAADAALDDKASETVAEKSSAPEEEVIDEPAAKTEQEAIDLAEEKMPELPKAADDAASPTDESEEKAFDLFAAVDDQATAKAQPLTLA